LCFFRFFVELDASYVADHRAELTRANHGRTVRTMPRLTRSFAPIAHAAPRPEILRALVPSSAFTGVFGGSGNRSQRGTDGRGMDSDGGGGW
jgi:hypothetical protein